MSEPLSNELDEIMEWVKWVADRNDGLLDSHKRKAITMLQTLFTTQNTALLKEVADEVIGADDMPVSYTHRGFALNETSLAEATTNLKIQARNKLRSEQRSKLTAMGEQ